MRLGREMSEVLEKGLREVRFFPGRLFLLNSSSSRSRLKSVIETDILSTLLPIGAGKTLSGVGQGAGATVSGVGYGADATISGLGKGVNATVSTVTLPAPIRGLIPLPFPLLLLLLLLAQSLRLLLSFSFVGTVHSTPLPPFPHSLTSFFFPNPSSAAPSAQPPKIQLLASAKPSRA